MHCHDHVGYDGGEVLTNSSLTTNLLFTLSLGCPTALPAGQRGMIVYDTHDTGRHVISPDGEITLRPCEVVLMEIGE